MKTKIKTHGSQAAKRSAAAKGGRKTRKGSLPRQTEFWRQETQTLRHQQQAVSLRKKPIAYSE
ncbi:MAG: hypothetical protein ABFD92_06750 [Planctomycetaceae bacterium]|nr:hypothetical protein [Planctomycetaceae bacterium]